jgi:glutaminyl-peptide cyclotransferase
MQRLRELAVAPIYSVNVIKRFKQKQPVFVQGLDLQDHRLYTSSGLYGKSFLRVSNLQSGNVLRQIHMRKNLFAEGITLFHHKLYQLFLKSGRGFVYSATSLKKISEFAVKGEGWGITHDEKYLIMSNGSPTLYFLDPKADYKVIRKIKVHDGSRAIKGLNELSYFKHTLYANVWYLDAIAMISPETGEVTGWIDLSQLHPEQNTLSSDCAVANGTAVNPLSGNLIVTGKCWSHLYEIQVLR